MNKTEVLMELLPFIKAVLSAASFMMIMHGLSDF